MINQVLIIVLMGLLSQCAQKKEEATTASQPQREVLDPNLYTMTAYVMTVPLVEQRNTKITGQWLDGGGEFIPGSDNRLTRLRHTLTPAQHYQDLQFKVAVNDVEASSSLLSFKDCDFTASLGYPSEEFRHMVLNYNFIVGGTQGDSVSQDAQPAPMSLTAGAILERAPLGASGPDDLAVQCERVQTRQSGRLITLKLLTSLNQQMKIDAEGKTLVPMMISRESFTDRIEQYFDFDFPASASVADAKAEISVRSPKGNHSYQVSFQRCISLVGNQNKDLIISQEHALYVDEKGMARDGGDILCCLSNGTCQQVVYGLHK